MIGVDGGRPTQPPEGKEEEWRPLWFLQLGPINLTRGRFKGYTYDGPYQIMRSEGRAGVSRYIAYLQDVKKKKGALSSEQSVFAEYSIEREQTSNTVWRKGGALLRWQNRYGVCLDS